MTLPNLKGILKQNVEEKSCGIMEALLENPGLHTIVRNISSYLDPKSLAQCRVVCHSWKDLIDNDRQWLIFQLENIHKQENTFTDLWTQQNIKWTIKALCPEWNTFVEEVLKRQNIPILKEVIKWMWIYFKDESMNCYRNPLHHAVAESNIEFVQIFIKS